MIDIISDTIGLPIKIKHSNFGEIEVELILCPHCGGVFAVDSTYLDDVDDVIHCPMCCMEMIVLELDE